MTERTVTCSPRYYIAGPMRNHPEFNFPAFFAKEAELKATGCVVFNPAQRDVDKGFDPTGLLGDMQELANLDFSLREALAADTNWICMEATHIHMLPGWSKSSGATAERALGLALGLTIEGAAA